MMGSCLSCRLASGGKTQAPPSTGDNLRSRSSQKQKTDSDDGSSNLVDRTASLSSNSTHRPCSGLESGHGREKRLSICSTYSNRPLQNLPPEISEDSVLTTYDFFNIINDGSLNAYIHEEGNFLIVDCRALEAYRASHVVTARHISEINSDPSFKSGMGYSLFNIVIIYGDNLKSGKNKSLVSTLEEISMNVAGEVLVLSEGFNEFKGKFPFMCTSMCIRTKWERRNILTYPSIIINEKLYQGKGNQATNLKVIQDLKITHIINITKEHQNAFPDEVKYLKLPIEDEKSSNLLKYFEETSQFIETAFQKKGVVFVHCNLGVSRSSSVVLAYLMKSQKISLGDAHSFLKSRRSCARPNIGFLAQLSEWEEQVLGSKVTNYDQL